MYTLYYTTRSYTSESTSLIPRIALEEIGTPYEVVEVELEPEPPAWYLTLNPHGKIPSLIESQPDWTHDTVVYPSSAILLYLADRHPEAELFPMNPQERGTGFRKMFDMAEMLQSSFIMFFYPERYTAREEDASQVQDKAVEWLERYWRRIDDTLHENPYLLGGRYSICDIYLYVLARWYVDVRNRIGGGPLPPFESLRCVATSCALIESRPAVARSLAADDLGPIAKRA